MEYNSQYNPQYNSGGAQGGYGYQPDPSDTLRIMRREKRQIRKLGNISGLGILLFALFQFVGAGILFLLNLFDDYANSTDRGYAIGVMMSVFCIFVPFFLTSLLLKDKRQQCLNFGKPYDMRLMFLAVPVGLMICMIGNYATNFLSTFVETTTGITFEYPDSPTPTSPLGIAMYLLQLAVVPALVEEYALRGVVMMPARKFGNWFAVLVSSALFGMMHGNLVQAPFAFIVGIGIGYFVIVTGSMWTGVMIHFCNNFFSGVISILYEFMPEKTVDIIYYVCVAVFFAAGIICLVLFRTRARKQNIPVKFKKPRTALSRGERTAAYFMNIPMILSIIYLLYTTYTFITWPS